MYVVCKLCVEGEPLLSLALNFNRIDINYTVGLLPQIWVML